MSLYINTIATFCPEKCIGIEFAIKQTETKNTMYNYKNFGGQNYVSIKKHKSDSIIVRSFF